MARTRKSALWVGTESSYSTAPAGSSMLYVPVQGRLGLLKDQMTIIKTKYFTGRNWDTPSIFGADGWGFEFDVPFCGLATFGGVGAGPPTADYEDILLGHAMGTTTTINGRGVASSTSTTVTYDSGAHAVQDLIPIYDAAITVTGGNRTQWQLGFSVGGTVVPGFTTNPTGAGIAYAVRCFDFDDDGGSSLSFVYRQDDVDYLLTGGRCISASIIGNMNEIAILRMAFAGDTKTSGANGFVSGLPSITAYSRVCKMLLSPFWFGATSYETRKMEINLGIKAEPRDSTAAANGRSDFALMYQEPTVTIEPVFASALQDIKRAQTSARLLCQFGAGVVSGSTLNTAAFHAECAQLVEADPIDDKNRIRQALKFQVSDSVEFSAGVAARVCQIARA